ncbi:MAG TPA: hypothetical protein VGK00_08195 [Anaerolineales bacterium]|jgi:hypothetical protein
MTTPEIEPEVVPTSESVEEPKEDEKRRRVLLILLLFLLLCLCCMCGLIVRYLAKPQALPEMLLPTQVAGCYRPTYKFSINNVDGPVAVAVSPDNQRIYAAEGKGERLIKMFDRDGKLITSFAPPGTDKANRETKYMAVDPTGRVFIVDRTSNAIDIYDQDGKFIDAIIGQQLTLSKFLTGVIGPIPDGTEIVHYEGINKMLSYKLPGDFSKTIQVTFSADAPQWSPLGLRFDGQGNLIYTDVTSDLHSVHIIPVASLTGSLSAFAPQIKEFGAQGAGNDQFDFPQTVVQDGTGKFYISDGNKARISVWTPEMTYKTFFGFGSETGALNLPRGIWMGARNCLYVADAVGSLIRVYDVSGAEPAFSYEIGGYGVAEGAFNYPIDVFIDGTGRLYVADRGNNRIQVWSH